MERPLRSVTAACFALAVLVACGDDIAGPQAVVAPQTSSVAAVNATYEREFAAALPRLDGNRAPPDSFDGTLAAISDARAGGDLAPQVEAALTVREGMVRLQTGELGQAHALSGEIAAAARTLGSGALSRDALVARAWPALLTGESALAAIPDAPPGSDAAQAAGLRLAPVLADAGTAVRRTLCTARGRLAAQDDGAPFLAAYGSIYLANADALAVGACVLNPSAASLPVCAAAEDRRYLRQARDLMRAFLPPGAAAAGRYAQVAGRHQQSLARAAAPTAPPAAEDPCA